MLRGQVTLSIQGVGLYQLKVSKKLEGNPFSLAGRGQSPAAGLPNALKPSRRPQTRAAPTLRTVPAATVALQPTITL